MQYSNKASISADKKLNAHLKELFTRCIQENFKIETGAKGGYDDSFYIRNIIGAFFDNNTKKHYGRINKNLRASPYAGFAFSPETAEKVFLRLGVLYSMQKCKEFVLTKEIIVKLEDWEREKLLEQIKQTQTELEQLNKRLDSDDSRISDLIAARKKIFSRLADVMATM
jgi:hypothetical protein